MFCGYATLFGMQHHIKTIFGIQDASRDPVCAEGPRCSAAHVLSTWGHRSRNSVGCLILDGPGIADIEPVLHPLILHPSHDAQPLHARSLRLQRDRLASFHEPACPPTSPDAVSAVAASQRLLVLSGRAHPFLQVDAKQHLSHR